jgi:cellulose synthase/poly-beta-1,6-N-acetylglucosamine synthase-like glycosyltransferase
MFAFSIFPPFLHYLRSSNAKKNLALPEVLDYQPKITILLPTRNESSNIERKIEEVISMDYPLSNINLLIIDSCSSDDTVSLARDYLSSSFPSGDWEVISLEKAGKSIAVNYALEIIETELFVMMDSDAICDADALKLIVSWFSDQKIGAVCGQHLVDKKKQDYHYRSRFNTLRVGESSLDSTPIFEGSICAFRLSALSSRKIDDRINADDSQLAILSRKNGFKSVMDPRILFVERSDNFSRTRRVRRAQGLMRVLFSNRYLCSGNGIFSRIMLQSIYFHTIFPWAILLSILMISLPIVYFPYFDFEINYEELASFLTIFSIFMSRTGRGLVSGSTVVIEAQIRLLFGQSLASWIPERGSNEI